MNIACPHCKSEKFAKKLWSIEINEYPVYVVLCDNCKHTYTWYNFDLDIEKLYKTEAYAMDDQRNSIFFKIQLYEYKRVLKKVISKLKIASDHQANLLDFGSGKGQFLYFAKQMGFKTLGVETAADRAIFASEKYNLEIIRDYYDGEGKINDTTFDVISMFHVLEHLSEPEKIGKGLFAENLKVNGILILEVPNLDSWQAKIGGKYWLHLDIPRHLSHYSYEYLKNFIESIGGDIFNRETFSTHLGIIGMLQSLMTLFGYRDSLIVDLKFNRTLKLKLSILILIIPAFILEIVASMLGKGGVNRVYLQKSPKSMAQPEPK